MYINLEGPTLLILILPAIVLVDIILVKTGRSKRYQYMKKKRGIGEE